MVMEMDFRPPMDALAAARTLHGRDPVLASPSAVLMFKSRGRQRLSCFSGHLLVWQQRLGQRKGFPKRLFNCCREREREHESWHELNNEQRLADQQVASCAAKQVTGLEASGYLEL